MLANSDDGGPLEVFLVMCKAPLVWSTILVIENIRSLEELYEKVNDHDAALIESVKHQSTEVVTVHNLASTMHKLGLNPNSGPSTRHKRANLASTEETSDDVPVSEQEPTGESQEGNETIRQVYQNLKKCQRPPPKGDYPFPNNNHATTRMGNAPPSPCKVCGSSNHWDKECPDYDTYLEKVKRGVLLVSTDPASEQAGLLYHGAYSLSLVEEISSTGDPEYKPEEAKPRKENPSQMVPTEMNQDNGYIAQDTLNYTQNPSSSPLATSPIRKSAQSVSARNVQMVEIEDEYWENEARMSKARTFLLELMEEEEDGSRREESQSEASEEEEDQENQAEAQETDETKPPPAELELIFLKTRRKTRPGDSAIGVSVLSV
ncbi:hypothetical protein DFH09DRAFT_1313606 [Mycena vulgaris]|nr:hypothetical protein DFH09DRAFT_1313606 [Mycena vulgaris]